MPYILYKVPGKEQYFVLTKATGKPHSLKPLTKEKALAQMRALYALGY